MRAGVITGVIVAVLFLLIVFLIKKTQGKQCNYDERQELVRGRGFRYAFFTLMAYNLLLAICYVEGGAPTWCDTFMCNYLGVLIALTVFGVYCIWNEAYATLQQSPKIIYIWFGFMAALQILIGITNIKDGRAYADGKILSGAASLLLGITFILFLLVYLVKKVISQYVIQDEEE